MEEEKSISENKKIDQKSKSEISKPTRDEESGKEGLEILEGYQHEFSYVSSRGPKRKKRIIHCKYKGCNKQFIKAWNFLDHARMHLGEKPFVCEICDSHFTQKGNLKKHLKKHERSVEHRKTSNKS